MDGENTRFCTECGERLPENAAFCPKCGNDTHSDGKTVVPKRSGNELMLVAALCGIYVLIAAYFAYVLMTQTDSLISSLQNSEYWQDIAGVLSEDDIRNMIAMMGYAMAVSGVFSAIAAGLCATGRKYTIALVCCISASLCGMVMLMGAFGLVVAYLIYRYKENFLK